MKWICSRKNAGKRWWKLYFPPPHISLEHLSLEQGRHSVDEYPQVSLALKGTWWNHWHLDDFLGSLDFTSVCTLEPHCFWLLRNLDLIEVHFVFLLHYDLSGLKGEEPWTSLYIYFISKHDFALQNYRRNIIQIFFWKIMKNCATLCLGC